MKINNHYDKTHKKELPSFKKIVDLVMKGRFWLLSVRIDEEEFGAQRIVIFIKQK